MMKIIINKRGEEGRRNQEKYKKLAAEINGRHKKRERDGARQVQKRSPQQSGSDGGGKWRRMEEGKEREGVKI